MPQKVETVTSVIQPSYSFTRLANATPYASGQLIANDSVAANVKPMQWVIGYANPQGGTNNSNGVGHTVYVTGVRLKYDDPDVTNAQFRIHIYKAAPTIATTGDTGTYGTVVSGYDNWLGSFDVTAVALHADGAAGVAVATEGAMEPIHLTGLNPSSPVTLYGLIEARAAYTPKSSGIIKAELLVEMS